MSKTLELLQALIRCESITPNDAGCQSLLASRLRPLGFHCESLRFGKVDNLWAKRGDSAPLVVFAGHTDVVPPGPLHAWHSPPFVPTIRDGLVFGRGTADMKGALAAMIVGTEQFVAKHPTALGAIGFLITSDEEGEAKDGTVQVVDWLKHHNERITYCIVGEPSSDTSVGDVVKNGRRGSLGCTLHVQGVQGHVAYPQLADNPIHKSLQALAELSTKVWDTGNSSFPPTTFQISNIHAGTGATNVIPGVLEVVFNFRFSTESTAESLQAQTEAILRKHGLNYHANWHLSGLPFETQAGPLLDAVSLAIHDVKGIVPTLSTAGGTSDGRFIAPTGAHVVELGLVNATIHQANEHVRVADLDVLASLYCRILEHLLITQPHA